MRVNGDTLRRFFRASVVQAADAISDSSAGGPGPGGVVSVAGPAGARSTGARAGQRLPSTTWPGRCSGPAGAGPVRR